MNRCSVCGSAIAGGYGVPAADGRVAHELCASRSATGGGHFASGARPLEEAAPGMVAPGAGDATERVGQEPSGVRAAMGASCDPLYASTRVMFDVGPPSNRAMTNEDVRRAHAHVDPRDQDDVEARRRVRELFAALAVQMNDLLAEGDLKAAALDELRSAFLLARRSVELDGRMRR